MKKSVLALAIASVFVAGPALAGDAAKGKKVFNKCKACHVLEGNKKKPGPSLEGLYGRAAGTHPGFTKYSKAMKNSGIVWEDETLRGYLAAPKKYIKGNRMAFPGIKKQDQLDNLMAYLEETLK